MVNEFRLDLLSPKANDRKDEVSMPLAGFEAADESIMHSSSTLLSPTSGSKESSNQSKKLKKDQSTRASHGGETRSGRGGTTTNIVEFIHEEERGAD